MSDMPGESKLDARLGSLLSARQKKGRFRSLKEYDTSASSRLTDFSSNDYLGLTTDASLRAAYIARLEATETVLGSTGSRLLSGGTCAHRALETRLAEHFAAPAGLLFNSGWDANVSFFSTVPQPGDAVIYDELIHASVHDGMRGSRVLASRRVPFAHNDPAALTAVLQTLDVAPGATVFLAMESLYSMDGDFAPLPALLDVFDAFVPREQQCVVVDEAHTTGVYGSRGRGIVHALDEGNRVTVRLMTFGKGAGASGAVLLCSPILRSFLINFARPFIFSTAMPLSTVVALEAVWDLLASRHGDAKRADLTRVIANLHTHLAPLLARTPSSLLRLPDPTPVPFPGATGLDPSPPAPIVGLLTPTPHALSAYLLERGFIVRPVVPPTVPPGRERVRICLRAGVSDARVAELVGAIGEWAELQQNEKARL
ncbi:putative 8-amino-7-oxononanoatesynthase [Cutaneotrichosporon oleaginosum]|uniref:Putative 8-amino-7-oxononanoatesynthase n=1 Tax=Cutaneotrichosporon oleaginosum TaxID=879819 RepID=A0A0J0XPF5_9TREE|nr:putative 8-amino-7-oxononanoatesynthase [Cutaneotrichosporon oleaginosum]KLT42983.1 putative 8-amino-7-oxononanoatesynthase [Cutaneotrichosporon oleaginosum]TXT11808.1 hypothetical protein COLE_02218 [Cutaneotrichosporon oleaginosum]